MITVFAAGCESPRDDTAIAGTAIDEPSTEQHADTQVVLASVEVLEGEHSVTLHAHDPKQTKIGSMRFARASSTDALTPVEAEGYFDIRGLSEAEIDERARALEIAVDYPPLENRLGCALRMYQAIAVCMDDDAIILLCPIGLQAVLCECGPAFGITADKLEKICTF
jgi:hypothetical protein